MLLLLPGAVCAGPGVSPGIDDAARARAIELYDFGSYAEACPLLDRLDVEHETDGALLYRIHYCQRISRDPRTAATLERARQALEREAPNSPDLAAPFYLANAYANAGRLAEAREAAAGAVRRIDDGSLPKPTGALGMFRLGKLYADSGNRERATAWYLDALDAFEASSSAAPAYVQWASRYLADGAYGAGDYSEAELRYSILAEADALSIVELDRLAIARARLGLYEAAAQAWQQAVRKEPANADRARYSAALCRQAAELPDLPAVAADGRLWTDWSAPELEATLREAASAAGEIKAEAAELPRLDAKRAQLKLRLAEQRARFVAAALEYALQGQNIREAAFSGGYATLVFRNREWELPPPAAPQPPAADPGQ